MFSASGPPATWRGEARFASRPSPSAAVCGASASHTAISKTGVRKFGSLARKQKSTASAGLPAITCACVRAELSVSFGALAFRLERLAVGDTALRPPVRVSVETADLLIQRNKVFRGDRARKQRLEAVLDADVVERLSRARAARRVLVDSGAPDRRRQVGVAATRAVRIAHGVVDQRRRQ